MKHRKEKSNYARIMEYWANAANPTNPSVPGGRTLKLNSQERIAAMRQARLLTQTQIKELKDQGKWEGSKPLVFAGTVSKAVPRSKERYVSLSEAEQKLTWREVIQEATLGVSLDQKVDALIEIITTVRSQAIDIDTTKVPTPKGRKQHPSVEVKEDAEPYMVRSQSSYDSMLTDPQNQGIHSQYPKQVAGQFPQTKVRYFKEIEIRGEEVVAFMDQLLVGISLWRSSGYKSLPFRICTPKSAKSKNRVNAQRRINRTKSSPRRKTKKFSKK